MATILVIDDEPQVRAAVREVLEGAGYAVVEAGEGREGLHCCQTYPVDLVITDIHMPGQDGLETIRALKTLRPQVAIIAMTSGGYTGALDELTAATLLGAHRTLWKPMRRAELLGAVRALLAVPPVQEGLQSS
jgi:CheY-like chemotaxis protein